MRPLFPKEMRNDVCITMTVMSLDPDCSPEIAGMIGASLVTAVSEIPWNGPIGGVQVGLVDGEIVLNPTQEQRKKSDLALTVAATMDKIVMIEAGANEVDEDTMLNAIKAAHVEIKKTIAFINEIVAERGKPKIDFQVVGLDMDVFHAIKEKYLDDFKAAMDTDDKNVRDAALLPILDKIAAEYPDLSDADLDLVSYKMQKYVVRRWLLDEGKRVDGRGINEILADELSHENGPRAVRLVALSGPTHAEEVALDLPTTIVSASPDLEAAEVVQEVFSNTCMRVYTNTDIKGVELSGAMKNVIALGVGISTGLGYGDNARAALITRGIAEIARLGVAMGCNVQTFAGLAGIGDLIVTATSMHSRNNRAGILIGKGESPEQAVKEVGMVVEGITRSKTRHAQYA